jgi:hypothetical protein
MKNIIWSNYNMAKTQEHSSLYNATELQLFKDGAGAR